ncbi:MAG: hypothetical protein ACTHOK_14710 [Nocardioidaceae bacterium]
MTSTGWAFTAACQRLADEPPPRDLEHLVDAPRQREQLRRTLEETVIGKPPPLRGMQPSFTSGPMPPGLHPGRSRRPIL